MHPLRRFALRTLALPVGLLAGITAPPAAAGAAALEGDRLLATLSEPTRRELRATGMSMIPDGATYGATRGSSESRIWVRFASHRNLVLRQLIQSARQTEYRPELREVRIVEDFENGQVCDYHLRMMLMGVRYRVRHQWSFERGTFWWSLDPSHENDLAVLDGRWELYPLSDGGTLARFSTRIDVGALPAFLQDYATRTKLPESVDHVRQWVDSRGTYRP
jgi:hypothetical protein